MLYICWTDWLFNQSTIDLSARSWRTCCTCWRSDRSINQPLTAQACMKIFDAECINQSINTDDESIDWMVCGLFANHYQSHHNGELNSIDQSINQSMSGVEYQVMPVASGIWSIDQYINLSINGSEHELLVNLLEQPLKQSINQSTSQSSTKQRAAMPWIHWSVDRSSDRSIDWLAIILTTNWGDHSTWKF